MDGRTCNFPQELYSCFLQPKAVKAYPCCKFAPFTTSSERLPQLIAKFSCEKRLNSGARSRRVSSRGARTGCPVRSLSPLRRPPKIKMLTLEMCLHVHLSILSNGNIRSGARHLGSTDAPARATVRSLSGCARPGQNFSRPDTFASSPKEGRQAKRPAHNKRCRSSNAAAPRSLPCRPRLFFFGPLAARLRCRPDRRPPLAQRRPPSSR